MTDLQAQAVPGKTDRADELIAVAERTCAPVLCGELKTEEEVAVPVVHIAIAEACAASEEKHVLVGSVAIQLEPTRIAATLDPAKADIGCPSDAAVAEAVLVEYGFEEYRVCSGARFPEGLRPRCRKVARAYSSRIRDSRKTS